MPEPLTMTLAKVAEAAAVAQEGASGMTSAVQTAELGRQFPMASGLTGTTTGGGEVESLVDSLQVDAQSLGESIRRRGEDAGPALSEALGRPGRELALTARSGVEAMPGGRAFNVARWTEWRAEQGERVGPREIAERFRPLQEPSHLEAYVRNLLQRDVRFAQEFSRRELQFRGAESPAEKDSAVQQMRKSTAGKLGESIAMDGFRAFFDNIEVPSRMELADSTTFRDGRFVSARSQLLFGRGHGVAEGGNLSVEVKTGLPPYLQREVQHIAERQVPGHLAAGDKSLVLVSRDVYDMSNERALRDTVKDAGSYVMALLPEKRVMDDVLLRILRERTERA